MIDDSNVKMGTCRCRTWKQKKRAFNPSERQLANGPITYTKQQLGDTLLGGLMDKLKKCKDQTNKQALLMGKLKIVMQNHHYGIQNK